MFTEQTYKPDLTESAVNGLLEKSKDDFRYEGVTVSKVKRPGLMMDTCFDGYDNCGSCKDTCKVSDSCKVGSEDCSDIVNILNPKVHSAVTA